jgi:hypothetical protein
MAVKYILIVFLEMQNGIHPVEAQLDMSAWDCMRTALRINTESTTGRMAVCMPLTKGD